MHNTQFSRSHQIIMYLSNQTLVIIHRIETPLSILTMAKSIPPNSLVAIYFKYMTTGGKKIRGRLSRIPSMVIGKNSNNNNQIGISHRHVIEGFSRYILYRSKLVSGIKIYNLNIHALIHRKNSGQNLESVSCNLLFVAIIVNADFKKHVFFYQHSFSPQ